MAYQRDDEGLEMVAVLFGLADTHAEPIIHTTVNSHNNLTIISSQDQ